MEQLLFKFRASNNTYFYAVGNQRMCNANQQKKKHCAHILRLQKEPKKRIDVILKSTQ